MQNAAPRRGRGAQAGSALYRPQTMNEKRAANHRFAAPLRGRRCALQVGALGGEEVRQRGGEAQAVHISIRQTFRGALGIAEDVGDVLPRVRGGPLHPSSLRR